MSLLKPSITFALFLATVSAQLPSPALLVLNKDEATLAIVDPQSRKVVARVPTGEGPHELAVSSDGKSAYIGNYGARTPGNSLSVIDLGSSKEIRRVDIAPLQRPHGIAVGDGKVYFTAEANKLIARYDPAANRIDWFLGTGQNVTHMILLSGDLNRMFTANIGSDSITVIDRASGNAGWNETVVPVGKGPEGFDVSPEGRELWAANSRDGSISIIDIAAKKVTGTIDIKTLRSNRLKFTPDGKLVLVSDLEGGELVIVDVASHKETKRVKLGRAPEGILIEPSGALAYVSVSGENRVAIIDLKTLEVSGVIETGKGPDGLAWVPAK